AHRTMKNALEEACNSRIEDLPLDSPYELLILASIIEKETSLDDERQQIAGVFARRLNMGMRLQTDPTVIYGIGESYDGNIRRRDLQTDTPYNTYTRHGLPPTPIAMPGKASLMAAAHPAEGETLYFVADGKGGHTFSTNLEAHQQAVKKLIERK
ncbi:MAG: endolytic transglycosylase MltG, partial [Gammaproteobacteria bacterium]|nr:endolytic transglycosylase MltG [Gammaproteobacteria bacterium]